MNLFLFARYWVGSRANHRVTTRCSVVHAGVVEINRAERWGANVVVRCFRAGWGAEGVFEREWVVCTSRDDASVGVGTIVGREIDMVKIDGGDAVFLLLFTCCT